MHRVSGAAAREEGESICNYSFFFLLLEARVLNSGHKEEIKGLYILRIFIFAC